MGLAVADPDDDWNLFLRDKILARLLGQVTIDSRDINALRVEVNNGHVRLEGVVESQNNAETIERLVWGYVEVRSVDNQIVVRSIDRPDIALQQEVWVTLYNYVALRWPPVTVTVDEGVVTLTGVVQEAVDRTDATLQTGTVPGIRGLKNLLEIESVAAGAGVASQVYSLLGNPFVFGRVRDLGVEMDADGAIHLMGYVWREADRMEAERLAFTVAGVDRVINRIELDLPSGWTVQEGDTTVQ